jgi:hypothetical protein
MVVLVKKKSEGTSLNPYGTVASQRQKKYSCRTIAEVKNCCKSLLHFHDGFPTARNSYEHKMYRHAAVQ